MQEIRFEPRLLSIEDDRIQQDTPISEFAIDVCSVIYNQVPEIFKNGLKTSKNVSIIHRLL